MYKDLRACSIPAFLPKLVSLATLFASSPLEKELCAFCQFSNPRVMCSKSYNIKSHLTCNPSLSQSSLQPSRSFYQTLLLILILIHAQAPNQVYETSHPFTNKIHNSEDFPQHADFPLTNPEFSRPSLPWVGWLRCLRGGWVYMHTTIISLHFTTCRFASIGTQSHFTPHPLNLNLS